MKMIYMLAKSNFRNPKSECRSIESFPGFSTIVPFSSIKIVSYDPNHLETFIALSMQLLKIKDCIASRYIKLFTIDIFIAFNMLLLTLSLFYQSTNLSI